MGFPLAEVSRRCPPGFLDGRPDLRGVRTVTGMELPEATPQAVLDWLRRGGR